MKKTLDFYININYNTCRPVRKGGNYKNMTHILIKLFGIALALVVLVWATGRAIDQHFDNQDRMLCHSAKVSGNAEYLNKCECFYSGEAVSCIHRNAITKSTDAGVEGGEY